MRRRRRDEENEEAKEKEREGESPTPRALERKQSKKSVAVGTKYVLKKKLVNGTFENPDFAEASSAQTYERKRKRRRKRRRRNVYKYMYFRRMKIIINTKVTVEP